MFPRKLFAGRLFLHRLFRRAAQALGLPARNIVYLSASSTRPWIQTSRTSPLTGWASVAVRVEPSGRVELIYLPAATTPSSILPISRYQLVARRMSLSVIGVPATRTEVYYLVARRALQQVPASSAPLTTFRINSSRLVRRDIQ